MWCYGHDNEYYDYEVAMSPPLFLFVYTFFYLSSFSSC